MVTPQFPAPSPTSLVPRLSRPTGRAWERGYFTYMYSWQTTPPQQSVGLPQIYSPPGQSYNLIMLCIMLLLSLILWPTNYSENYASIIGLCLLSTLPIIMWRKLCRKCMQKLTFKSPHYNREGIERKAWEQRHCMEYQIRVQGEILCYTTHYYTHFPISKAYCASAI